MTLSSGKNLLNLAGKNQREQIQKILFECGIKAENTQLEFSMGDEMRAYLSTDSVIEEEMLYSIKKQILEQTGIKLYIVK